MSKTGMKKADSILPSKSLLQRIAFRVAGSAMIFAIQLLLCRLMGPNQFGHFAVISTVLGLLVVVATFGFDSVVQVFLPKYNEDLPLRKGLVRFSNRCIALSSLICMTGLFMFLVTYSQQFKNVSLSEGFLWAMLMIPFAALLQHTDKIVRKLQGKKFAVPVAITVSLLTLCGSLYKYFSDKTLLVDTVFMIALLVSALMYVVFRTRSKRLLNHGEIEAKYEYLKWTKYAGQFFIADLINFLIANAPILLISYFANNLMAGHFFVALKFSALITVAAAIVTANGIPVLYDHYRSKDKKSFLNGISNGSFRLLSVTLPAAFILFLTGPSLLRLFDPQISANDWMIACLLISQLLSSLATLNGKALTISGKRNTYLLLSALVLIIMMVCGALFIPAYDLTGVSIAVLISSAVYFITTTSAVRRSI